ncbi:stage III sporulation protein AG [Saliterribacillus persicus]|uniref:stage III sporulation protein AG n=1 Tax=Saliterribacillus persicus TaxID=930114 RepID=UPI001FE2BCF5|nr:stage III sporulation protein AG [Saliterribacillus persicus]
MYQIFKDMWRSFSNLFSKNEKNSKLMKISFIAILGIAILGLSNMFSTQEESSKIMPSLPNQGDEISSDLAWNQESSKSQTDEMQRLESSYEEELGSLLNKIDGVSEVEVMLNFDATNKHIFEKNLVIGKQVTEETDQNGGKRKIEDETKDQSVVIIRQGDQEVPISIQTQKPTLRGALIIAKGVDHLEVKKWVIDAVSKVLDVPSHRVSVLQKK